MTKKLDERLDRHNKGYVKSTKRFASITLFYFEKCQNSQQAREREKFLKSTSGKRFLKSILSKQINTNELANKLD